MRLIANIDKEIYSCITKDIRSDKVILTNTQKDHIIERRGQDFFDRFSPYFSQIAEDPDYIFRDKKHDNTAIACKTLEDNGKNVHLVIRLAVEGDDAGRENSIITALIESDKRYQQRLRNNSPLYKRE